MKRFRLHPVLQQREREETIARQEMVAQEMRHQQLQAHVAEIEHAIANALAEQRQLMVTHANQFSSERVEAFSRYLNWQRQRLQEAKDAVTKHAPILEKARELLKEAAIARKSIDKLRERHEQREKSEAARLEQLTLDETATQRFVRRSQAV